MASTPFEEIDYAKYLGCKECRKVGLYCTPHRAEVEEILGKYYCRLPKPCQDLTN